MNHIINKKKIIILSVGILFVAIAGILEITDGFYIRSALLAIAIILILVFARQAALARPYSVIIKTEDQKQEYIKSIIDAGTKLYNKEYLLTEFTKVFDCNPTMFKNSICVFIDIDNFTILSEKFGKIQEEETIKQLSSVICSSKREGDFSFKYSKDQYIIFYMNAELDPIKNKVDHIRYSFKTFTRENFKLPGTKFTLSIGVTKYQFGEDLTDIMHRANKAMYVSKLGGRDKISVL